MFFKDLYEKGPENGYFSYILLEVTWALERCDSDFNDDSLANLCSFWRKWLGETWLLKRISKHWDGQKSLGFKDILREIQQFSFKIILSPFIPNTYEIRKTYTQALIHAIVPDFDFCTPF